MPQRKAQKGKRTMPVVVTSSPADAGRPEHRRAPCSGNGGRLPKRLRARVPEADPCCERPLVHLAGYTSFVEPDGTVVYTKKTDSLIPKPMYSRETHEEAYRRMCERRLPRLTYEGLESDPGELTDSNDSEESMTPPDHAKGDSIMVHGKPCKTFRVEPHQRERVMQLLAEGVEASYTRAARKYERYLRRMHHEAAAEQELGAFTSLRLGHVEPELEPLDFNSSDLAPRRQDLADSSFEKLDGKQELTLVWKDLWEFAHDFVLEVHFISDSPGL